MPSCAFESKENCTFFFILSHEVRHARTRIVRIGKVTFLRLAPPTFLLLLLRRPAAILTFVDARCCCVVVVAMTLTLNEIDVDVC